MNNAPETSESTPPTAHILVVDGDAAITAGTAQLLSRHGYTVIQANSGEQGLHLAQQRPPDLILLDVMLPDIEGPEVCRQLKADSRVKDSFIVLCSALRTDSGSVVLGFESGADDYLSRPLENCELLARVRAYLRHKTTIDGLRDGERHWHEQFEREHQAIYEAEVQALGNWMAGSLPVTARLLGAGPLSETAPTVFGEMQSSYGSLLRSALDQRIFRVENVVTVGLSELAKRLFRLRAGARDVTELHYQAFATIAAGKPPRAARALLEIGRLTLLELMGLLLNAYRSRYPEVRIRSDAGTSHTERVSS